LADPQDPTTPPPGNQMPLGGGRTVRENLIPINIEDEMKRSYLDYAMSVIVGPCAFPDVRDGFEAGASANFVHDAMRWGCILNRPTKKAGPPWSAT